jgi:hypothetical protein
VIGSKLKHENLIIPDSPVNSITSLSLSGEALKHHVPVPAILSGKRNEAETKSSAFKDLTG